LTTVNDEYHQGVETFEFDLAINVSNN